MAEDFTLSLHDKVRYLTIVHCKFILWYEQFNQRSEEGYLILHMQICSHTTSWKV